MKQRSQIEMRMELLEVGEKLGWPRVGYGLGKRCKAGEAAWTAMATRAPMSVLAPLLRNARILAEYGAQPAALPPPKPASDDTRAKRIAGLAKAREIKAAKRAKEVAVSAD